MVARLFLPEIFQARADGFHVVGIGYAIGGLLFGIAAVLASPGVAAEAAAPTKAPRSVTLDVKDADVREILGSLREQCGVRNMLIDDDVIGAGTVYFRDVACDTAFRVVFRQFGLAGRIEPNSVVTVRRGERQ